VFEIKGAIFAQNQTTPTVNISEISNGQ